MPQVLTAGDLTLEVLPETGGCIGSFRLGREDGAFDLMRPMGGPRKAPADALYSGMFPMLPFANCIRDNRFVFEGRHYEVPSNMAGSRLNFHGSGWQSSWEVDSRGDGSLRLVLPGGQVGDAYRYSAEQVFHLDAAGLSVSLTLTNRGDRRMPFGFGQHPWFPRHEETLIRFGAAGLWLGDADGQATTLVPVPAEADYSAPRQPPTNYRNSCYAGWDGRAEIAWPGAGVGLTLTGDPVFGHLMFHVPATGEAVFCLEPQSNAPCGFDGLDEGRAAPGVHILDPGQQLSGSMRFTVSS